MYPGEMKAGRAQWQFSSNTQPVQALSCQNVHAAGLLVLGMEATAITGLRHKDLSYI